MHKEVIIKKIRTPIQSDVLVFFHSSLLSLVARHSSLVADSLVALSHTAHHAQARTNRRKDGDEGLNHNFPKFTFFHSS